MIYIDILVPKKTWESGHELQPSATFSTSSLPNMDLPTHQPPATPHPFAVQAAEVVGLRTYVSLALHVGPSAVTVEGCTCIVSLVACHDAPIEV